MQFHLRCRRQITNATEQLQKARMEWTDFHDTFKDELKWTPEQISQLRATFISFRMKGAGRLSDWPSQTPVVPSRKQEDLVYENATECLKLLEAAGMGKAGKGNCPVDMVKEACEKLVAARVEPTKDQNLEGETPTPQGQSHAETDPHCKRGLLSHLFDYRRLWIVNFPDETNKDLIRHLHFVDCVIQSVQDQLRAIPQSNDYRANRYDTDNEIVLSVWADGKTFDIRLPKTTETHYLDPAPKELSERDDVQISTPSSQPQATKEKEEHGWKVKKDERTIQLLDHNGKVLLQHDHWGPHHIRLFQSIADAHNDQLSGWIKTSHRPPTKEDADGQMNVLVRNATYASLIFYGHVEPGGWPFWMPIPGLL